jgi:hypothetical protein
MKKFLVHTILFAAPVLTSILFVFFIANGKSDSFYVRFTTPKQHSLILGTSGAAHGLQPKVFDEIIYKDNTCHFFNYSFTLYDSPYGYAYYQSIKKKLDTETKNGIFIITVNPWSLCSKTKNPNDSANFIENKSFIAKTTYVNLNPNIPYLVNSYSEPYINIIRKWVQPTDMYLRDDGWLEIDAPMDSSTVAKRLQNKLKDYRENYLPFYRLSSLRLHYLNKTISFLQQHGKVYLVRLPIVQSLFDIEDELMPDFDEKMNNTASEFNVGYLNFKKMKNTYQYVDGGHLYKSSGKEVSVVIANWISNKKL